MKKDNTKEEMENVSNSKEQAKSGRTGKRSNNRKSNGNRRNNRMPKDKLGKGDLNPYYYAPDDTVMNQYTQLSNNLIGQTPIFWGDNELINPGLMRIKMLTSICSSPEAMVYGAYNGVNAACRKLYQELTAFTGRAATSYSAADLGVMLVCFSSILEWVSFAKRIYGSYRLYSPNNRAFNKAVLQLQGIKTDMDSAFNDLKYLNTLIDQMGSLIIPACPMLIKSVAMYDELYLDDESDMAQVIAYVPEYYFILDETTLPSGSMAECHSFTPIKTGNLSDLVSFKDVLDIIKSQLSALMTSATMAIVFADLINYANKVGSLTLIKPLPCEIDYTTPVRYSHEEVMRIHNAYFIGDLLSDAEGRVTQNPTYDTIHQGMTLILKAADGSNVTADHVARFNACKITEHGLLDFTTPEVDAAMMIEATRLICEPKNIAWNGVDLCAQATAVTSGDHIVTGIDICSIGMDGLITQDTPSVRAINTTLGCFAASNSGDIQSNFYASVKFGRLSYYQSAPMVLAWQGNVTATGTPSTVVGRRSFYKTFNLRYMSTLNDRIMQYMYSVVR